MKQLIVLLGVVGASLSAVFVRWSTAPSLVLVFYRMAITVVLMTPVVLLRCRRELAALHRREILLCLASGAALGLHFTCYFASLRYTSIAASVVLVDTEVLFVALATVVFWKKRLPRRQWCAILLAFGGSVTVAMADSAAGGAGALLGDGLALLGAVAVAVYTMIGSVCRRTVSTTAYTYLVYLAAGCTVLLAAAVRGTPMAGYGAVNLWMALGLAVFSTLLGHSVFSWGLKYLPAAFVSMAKLMEPVMAAVWGVLLFRELPGWPVLLGGGAIIAGLILYTRADHTETGPVQAGKEQES